MTPHAEAVPEPARSADARGRVAAALVALAGLAAYANALSGAFVWDDLENVLRNPWIREPGRLGEAFAHHMAAFSPRADTSYYRPLMHVLLAGVHRLAGLEPWSYHLALALLHAGACAAVLALAARVVPPREGERVPLAACAGALLFAVHPIHAEAVAWVSGVVDLSYSLLVLLALLAATSARAWARGPLAALLFFLALLGKEPAVMLLPALAAFAAARGDLRSAGGRRRLLGSGAALALALSAYLALRVAALGGLMGTGGTRRVPVGLADGVLTALALFGKYVALLVLPLGQSAVHDFPVVTSLSDPRVWLGVAAAVAACALAWRARHVSAAVLGIALLVLPILPALYVPVLGEGLVGERYLYLPSAGLALLVAAAWNAWARSTPARARTAPALVLALAAAGAAATVARNRVWHDELSLWQDAAAKSPGSAAAHESLGFALLEAGRPAEAVASLSRALGLDPRRRDARTNLASALAALGRGDEAAAQAESVLAEDPRNAEARAILARALAAQGDLVRAAREYRQALEVDARIPAVHNGLAIALARLGDAASAEVHFREAIRLDPANARYRDNLAALERVR